MCFFSRLAERQQQRLIPKGLHDTEQLLFKKKDTEQLPTSFNQNLWVMAMERASSSCGTQPDLCSQSTRCAARTSLAIDGTVAPSSVALTGYRSWQSKAPNPLHTPTSISCHAHDQSFPRSFHLQQQETSTSFDPAQP